MAQISDWTPMEILVTVKAYPAVSKRHGEVICVAGVRLDTGEPEWIRLFPVNFRDLPAQQQFKKWQVLRLRASKNSTDLRAESWKPDTTSLEPLHFIPTGDDWARRREFVEPLLGPTMCELNAEAPYGPSLGLVRAKEVLSLPSREDDGWDEGQKARLLQENLLSESKPLLERAGHQFSYRWLCENPDCGGHKQQIADWEIGQAYRSWQRRGLDPVEAIRKKWFDEICSEERETFFFVGDQHQRRGSFLVLGAYYPRYTRRDQLTLSI
jgi:hypothetical protein